MKNLRIRLALWILPADYSIVRQLELGLMAKLVTNHRHSPWRQRARRRLTSLIQTILPTP